MRGSERTEAHDRMPARARISEATATDGTGKLFCAWPGEFRVSSRHMGGAAQLSGPPGHIMLSLRGPFLVDWRAPGGKDPLARAQGQSPGARTRLRPVLCRTGRPVWAPFAQQPLKRRTVSAHIDTLSATCRAGSRGENWYSDRKAEWARKKARTQALWMPFFSHELPPDSSPTLRA